MYAHYVNIDRIARSELPGGEEWASSVLSDWVGMLTGAITGVAQLSDYADKNSCYIQGGAGAWEVFDEDANSKYPGQCKVLRKLCMDGLSWQYMYIGFRTHVSGSNDYLNGLIGFMGGWDSVEKTPTTAMKLSNGRTVADGTDVSTNGYFDMTSTGTNGSSASSLWDQAAYDTNPPVPYKILETPSLMTFWAEPTVNADSFPMGLIAEYENQNVWNTPEAGISPIIYTALNHKSSTDNIQIPFIRNSLGNVVKPDYMSACTVMGNTESRAAGTNGLKDAAQFVYEYTRDAEGNRVIPVLPIDINSRVNNNGWLCYNGRLRGIFATLDTLFVSDTFTIGDDIYVVIPTYGYSNNRINYSAAAKICARIE
jgi:hypothetical protein